MAKFQKNLTNLAYMEHGFTETPNQEFLEIDRNLRTTSRV